MPVSPMQVKAQWCSILVPFLVYLLQSWLLCRLHVLYVPFLSMCYRDSTSCAYHRRCYRDFSVPPSLVDPTLTVCTNNIVTIDFELPVDSTTGEYENDFYCSFWWDIPSNRTIEYSFDSFDTALGDKLYVYLGAYGWIYEGSSVALVPTLYPGVNGYSLSMYFVGDTDNDQDTGFDGRMNSSLRKYCAPVLNSYAKWQFCWEPELLSMCSLAGTIPH